MAAGCVSQVSFALGIIGAPAAISAAWALGATWSWLLLLVPLAGAALWCFWQWLRPKVWPLQEEFHSFQIRGLWVALVSTTVNVALYTVWFLRHRWAPELLLTARLLSCLQNLSVMCGFISALHLSTWLRTRAPRGWPLPLVSMLLALPWLLADHVPFAFLGKWPQTFDHAFAVTSTALAWTTSLLPPLQIGLQQEPGGKNAHGKDLCFNFERLQQLCAALSFLYLVVSFLWRKHGHLQVLDIAYHLIWSLLRPAYVLLFFVYHLKRVPCVAWLQSFACGVCFFYFLLFSALTETRLTYHDGTRFNGDEELTWTKFGRASTRVEELCFYISIMLFYAHGICSGAWAQGSRRFPSRIALFGFVVFVMVFLADYTHLDRLPWFDTIKKSRFGFVVLYYGLGYLSIVLINMSFFETRLADVVSLHRVSLTVVPAERLNVLAQPSQSCISCVRAEPLFRPGKAAVCAMPDLPEQFLAGRFV